MPGVRSADRRGALDRYDQPPHPGGKQISIPFFPTADAVKRSMAMSRISRVMFPVSLLTVVAGCSHPSPQLAAVLAGHTEAVTSISYSPDGARIASRSNDGTVRLWDPRSGRETALVGKVGRENGGLAFSSSGTRLATNDSSIGAVEWDLAKPSRRSIATRPSPPKPRPKDGDATRCPMAGGLPIRPIDKLWQPGEATAGRTAH